MASKEIKISYFRGSNLYARVFSYSGKVWNTQTKAFEYWNDADIVNYDIPSDNSCMTDTGGGLYYADFDVNIPSGRYIVNIYLRGGTNPSVDDELVGYGEIVWTGIGELTVDKILANKAIQDKLTGKIDYYDDDNQTVILTHTPADGESTFQRTPS
jgi:hypothetical protein